VTRNLTALLGLLLLAACSHLQPNAPGAPSPAAATPATGPATVTPAVTPAPPATEVAAASPPAQAAVPEVPAPNAVAATGSKPADTAAPARHPVPPKPAAPPPAAAVGAPPPAPPALNLASLEQRLRDTHAIGVFTKLSLKNQVDDLLDAFRAFYRGQVGLALAELRQRYDLLMLKVLSLLQDSDPPLANDIVASREAIWGILKDPAKFATIT
jgi:hypothetical protein